MASVRIGELLRRKGLITADQLQTALHEQQRFGGRLGTNLIQLGYVVTDTIALALSEQQELPPVLREHIASIDRKTIALFPLRIVTTHAVVPIGYTLTKPERLVVACMTPKTTPMEELAFAAGRRVEPWVAPEMVILECMERYFGGPAVPVRYVSMKLPTREKPAPAPPRAPASAIAAPAPAPPPRARITLEMPAVPAPAPAPAPVPPPSRRAVESAPEHEAAPQEAHEDWDIPDEPADPPPQPRPLTAPPEALRPFIDRAEASRLLEMATSKEQIGRALEDWLRSTFGCGLVLVVKGDMAIGWKGFFPDAEDLIEAVAIPLGKASMFATAYESRAPFRGPPPAEGARLQERLWKLLRCPPPAEVLIYPVTMGKRAVNLVYAHMEDGSPLTDAAVEDAAALCADAAAAYAKVIGKAKR